MIFSQAKSTIQINWDARLSFLRYKDRISTPHSLNDCFWYPFNTRSKTKYMSFHLELIYE